MEDFMSDLRQVLHSVETAKGLPNKHYTDEEVYNTEREHLFFNQWAGIGFAKDLPEEGDAMPINFQGVPLLAVHAKGGGIHVYHNVCRHRGMILVSEKKKVGGVIRCPYHSWCYSHKGELVTTPHVGGAGHNTHEAIHRDELGLIPVRSYVWRDVIFVNINNNAPEFEDYAKDLITRWREFDQDNFSGGASSYFTLDVKTNWKLAVENYCESYHLPWVHPGLNSYSRLEDHYNIEQANQYSGQGSLVYRQLDVNGLKFPDYSDLSEKWHTGSEYVAFYPNVLFGVHRDHSFAIILESLSVNETREHIALYYAQDIAENNKYSQLLSENAKLWKLVFEEDIFVVEGMQQGRYTKAFDGGKFSPAMDGPTHCFHHWAANQLLNAEAAE